MTASSPSPRQPRPPAAPEPEVDPADEAMRREMAEPTGPGAGWRPGDPDPLAEGLLVGALDAPRARRLATFQRDPHGLTSAWELLTAVRGAGADLAPLPDCRLQPRGFADVAPYLRDECRRQRDALATWLALEAACPDPALRRHARPPWGTRSALVASASWCICCGPPPPGAVAVFWTGPDHPGWRCDACCDPLDPREDDRVVFAAGRSGGLPPDDTAPAPHPQAPVSATGRP